MSVEAQGRAHDEPQADSEAEADAASHPDDSLRRAPARCVVGIGSSAGGLEALQDVVRNIPVGLAVSILVAQHLAPQHKSLMAELLGRETPLDVVVAEDGDEPRLGTVHVCPPGVDLVIRGGVIRLLPPAKAAGPKPSVDAMLASLAADFGERSVGVILSGTGSDGSYGMREIHAVGGLTIAQDPSTAKYASMPRAAIEGGIVDRTVAPDEVGEILRRLLAGELDHAGDDTHVPDTLVKRILSAMHSQTGVDYSAYKESTVRRQIARRMAVLQISDQGDYLTYLLAERSEARILGQNMLVSVTSFYRDPQVWDALGEILVGKLAEADDTEPAPPIRVWVPGCATGEEAYTVVMVLARALGFPDNLSERIKVFATDLDDAALEFARRGSYPAVAAERLPVDLRAAFTESSGPTMTVAQEVKDCVVFARHNLAVDPPFLRMDLVSCRNVLIYFENQLQDTVLRTIHYALRPAGLAVLGTSEGVGYLADAFLPVNSKWRIYQRSTQSLDIPRTRGAAGAPAAVPVRPLRHSEQTNDHQVLRESILRALAPPSIVVNEGGNLVQVLGDVTRFCQFPQGAIDMSVVGLVRPPLLPEVRRLLAHSRVSGAPIHGQAIDLGDSRPPVQVTVRPASSSLGAYQVVSFTESSEAMLPGVVTDPDSLDAVRLQIELDATRETLQSTIEELETANEELQAMNEEMMASTEELQASNEELETINEELQASNEELGTLNEELQVRSRELGEANMDLRNIQAAISQALVLVDSEKRITRYSPLAVRLFAMVEEDVGTPIDRVATTIPLPGLDAAMDQALRGGGTVVLDAMGPDVDYQVAVSAWRDDHGQVGGAVLSINDTTSLRASRLEAARVEEELGLVTGQIGVAAWTRRASDGALLTISEESVRLIGEPAERLCADPDAWLAHVLPEDREAAARCGQPGREQRIQFRTNIDGSVRTLLDIELGVLGASPDERFGTLQDITEAAETMRALSTEAALTSAAFQLPGRLLLQTNEAGRILRVSPGSEMSLGIPEDLVLHRRLADICVPDDREILGNWLARVGQGGLSTTVEVRSMGRDGVLRRLTLEGARVPGSEPVQLLLAATDITESRAEYDRLRRHSRTDALTGLASRTEMISALGTEMHRAEREGTTLALMWLDLDGFKDINDRYGHPAGDSALAEVAERMRFSMRSDVVVARMGGDEFALLLRNVEHMEQLDFVADQLLHALRSPLDVGTATCHVTGSVGIALFPNDSPTVDGLLQAADTAMYTAKRQGGDQFCFHVPGMHAESELRARLRQELADSIRSRSFTLHYQPIYNLAEGKVCAAEALLRRVLDDGSVQSAGEFIAVAEYSGQIRAMGRQMIGHLLEDVATTLPRDLPIAINLSPAELNDPTLITFMRQAGLIELLPRLLIEVTENILLEPRSTGMQTLSILRSLGARLALDDYGTGFSNMQTLEQLQPHLLKVDGSFTALAARGDPRGRAFIASARTLAKSLGSAVLSEGVETNTHLNIVEELGIPLGQGYHLGLVMPPGELADLVSAQGRGRFPDYEPQ